MDRLMPEGRRLPPSGSAEGEAVADPLAARLREVAGSSRTLGWRGSWPLVIAFVGYPVWWLLGFAPFVWIAVSVPMTFRLLVRKTPIRVPHGFGLWLIFLALVILSASQVDAPERLVGFGFRLGELIAATVIFVYAYNLPHAALSSWGGTKILAAVWAAVVAGGAIALAVPDLVIPSLASRVLPSAVSSNDFIAQLMTPSFAQVHTFLGYPLPRPAAPFTYTNTWGAVFALTLPFAIAFTLDPRSRRHRTLLVALLGVGMLPALLSVNRTMWAATVLVVAYSALAAPDPKTRQVLRGLAALGLVVLLALAATYVGDVVTQRIDTPHSNVARGELASAAVESMRDSPMLGHGQPQEYEGPGIRPPVGTQGQLWYVAISHGIPALLFFLAWFVSIYRGSRYARASIVPWTRAAILAGAVMIPFYGMRGMPLNALLLASALSLRPPPADAVERRTDC